jgi:hypothetical protein
MSAFCIAKDGAVNQSHSLMYRSGDLCIANYSENIVSHSSRIDSDSPGVYYFMTAKEDYICFEYIKIPKYFKTKFKATIYVNELISSKKLPKGLNLESSGDVEYVAVGAGGPNDRFTRAFISDSKINDNIYFAILGEGVLLFHIKSGNPDYQLYFRHKDIIYSVLGATLFHKVETNFIK